MKDQVKYDYDFVLMARLTLLGLNETVSIIGNFRDYRFYVRNDLLHYIDNRTLYDASWHYSTLRSIVGVLG